MLLSRLPLRGRLRRKTISPPNFSDSLKSAATIDDEPTIKAYLILPLLISSINFCSTTLFLCMPPPHHNLNLSQAAPPSLRIVRQDNINVNNCDNILEGESEKYPLGSDSEIDINLELESDSDSVQPYIFPIQPPIPPPLLVSNPGGRGLQHPQPTPSLGHHRCLRGLITLMLRPLRHLVGVIFFIIDLP